MRKSMRIFLNSLPFINEMRLLNLELENWALHSHLEVPLANSLQIEGRNGTGKSSILEAIRFIFARDARRYKRKIKNGTRSCTVKLTFAENGNEYLIEKKLHLKRSSTAQMLINSGMVASNPTEVYNRLQDILSENVLDKLLYVPQDGLVRLIENLRIKGGRQELDSLLGLDRFERVYDGIREELNVKQANFDLISNQILKYPEEAEKVFNKQINELEKEMISLEKEGEMERDAFEKLGSQIKKLGEEINRIQKVKKERDRIEKMINEMKLDIVKSKKEIEFIEQRLNLIEEKTKRYKKLSSEIKSLERYPRIRELLSNVMKREERLVDVDNIKEKEKELMEMQKELVKKEELEYKRKTTEAEIVNLERRSAAKKQSLSEREEYLKSLDALEDKAKCPRCGQKLTPQHIEKEKKIAENEVRNLKKALEGLYKELKNYRDELENKTLKLEKLRKKDVEAKHLEKEIEKKREDREKIISEIKKIRKKLVDAKYRNESSDVVDSRVVELHNIKGEMGILQEEMDKEGEYKKGLRDINNALLKISEEEKHAREKFKSLEFDETILDALQYEKDNLLKNRYEIQNRITKCELRIEQLKDNIKETEDKRKEFTELKKLESDLKKEIRLLKDARDIFHTNKGIVKYLRERYIMRLSEQMTYYFKRINQNPKYKRIEFDKDYNIEIKTTEGNFAIDQLSGGERVQLAIALRIALIRLISPINLLILDEPFGSLDKEHREILGEALNKIALDGQLILVTHIIVNSLDLPGRLELGGY